MNNNNEKKALASQIAQYMRYRSAREGTTSNLSGKDIYKAALAKGATSIFGIDVRPGFMRCDAQNPAAFRAWFTEFPHQIPAELILVRACFSDFTADQFERTQAYVMEAFLSGRFDCGASVVMLKEGSDPNDEGNWVMCLQTIHDAIESVRGRK